MAFPQFVSGWHRRLFRCKQKEPNQKTPDSGLGFLDFGVLLKDYSVVSDSCSAILESRTASESTQVGQMVFKASL